MTKRKSKKTYQQKLFIAKTLQEDLNRSLEVPEPGKAAALLKLCLDEEDSIKQAGLLKQVGSLLIKDDGQQVSLVTQQYLCIHVLAELFVASDAKHPARRTIASLLDNLPGSCTAVAQDYLTEAITNKISAGKESLSHDQGPSFSCGRNFTDLISSLLENFRLGTHVVTLMGFSVVEFLGICLKKLVIESRMEATSVARTSFMMDCLIYTKNIISVLQRYSQLQGNFHGHLQFARGGQSSGAGSVESEQGSCGIIHAGSREWASVLADIWKELLSVLNEESFLPDCRSTAGMALPLIARTVCEENQLIAVIVKTFFPQHLRGGVGAKSSSPAWLVSPVDNQPITGNTSFTMLCLCHGTLAMLPREVLLSSSEVIVGNDRDGPRSLLFDVLFPTLCDLCERLKESSSCLAVFRTLVLWTEEARAASTSQQTWLKPRLLGTEEISQKLLGFVWSHWDHPVEGVRYNTKAIFDGVIKTHVAVSEFDPSADVFLKKLAESLVKVDWHVRGKYGPLCCVAATVGARCMLGWYPDIPQDILRIVGDRAVAPHVIEFIEKLTQLHKDDVISAGGDLDEWMQTWIIPVLCNLRSSNKETRARLTEYCLPRLLKCCPESLRCIVDRLHTRQDPGSNASHLGPLITCLKTARTLGLIYASEKCPSLGSSDASSAEMWAGLVPVEMLQKCLCNVDDQVRLDALGLLCECPKSTEPVSGVDLRLLRTFAALNMNSQAPAFRQQAAASIRKLFFRLKNCMRILQKALKKTPTAPDDTERLSAYKEFLHWFCELQFSSVFPGASFARRTTALYNLIQVHKVFCDSDLQDDAFRFIDVMTTNNIRVLFDCLWDSYDVNKSMAYELLASCPEDRLPFQTPESLAAWLRRTRCLMASPRAVDTLSAALVLQLLIDKCSLPLRFHGNPFDVTSGEGEENEAQKAELLDEEFSKLDLTNFPCCQAFWMLCNLVSVLESHGAVAKENLSAAALRAPMHGILFCQRSLLARLPLNDLGSNQKWRHLVSRLLGVCLHIASLVSPVVTSSSPEGHTLDEDQQHDEGAGLGPDDVENGGHMFAPAAQALLVCCWRTMKEVALLLGELSQLAPIMRHDDGSDGLLTPAQVRQIGKFFTVILLTSKHRGAFELAYTGFVKLCGRLWRSEDESLCALPPSWLGSLLRDISAAVPSEVLLCGTRRSAGVPFLVQAIVATEPPSACRACLNSVMKELIEMASKPVEQENTTEDSLLPQVHARNILRALFRDARLGEHMFPFVSKGVAIALQGFLSDSWAVRNSSTLLFSALVTRIFGVKKTKDEDSRRNCMTGREFFSRFPDLHSFLLGELKKACEAIESQGGIHPSLYPVLLILSRLYPSSMDGVDSALNMAPFVPYVIRCGQSSVMKTRLMAAQALVPLVSGVALGQTLCDLASSLPASAASVNQNQVHGALLQIHHLLQAHIIDVKSTRPIIQQITTGFIPQLRRFAWIATSSNPCPITRSVFLEITLKLFVEITWMNVPGIDPCEVAELNSCQVRPSREFFAKLAVNEAQEWAAPSVSPTPLVGEVFVKETIAKMCLGLLAGDWCGTSCPPRIEASRGQPGSRDERPPDMTSRHPGSFDSRMSSVSPSALIKTLLRSPEYEVREIVLDHLTSRLRARGLRGRLTEESGSELFNKRSDWLECAGERGEVSVQLCEMALGSENHPECLTKVFEVLCCLPESCVFPWKLKNGKEVTVSQCWQYSVALISKDNQRAGLRCALLGFLATLIPQIYERSNIEKCSRQALREFSDVVRRTSCPRDSVEVRQRTAAVLGQRHMRDVLVDSLETLGDLPFAFWSVVVDLLQDDDMSVRETMAEGVSRCLQKQASVDCVDLPNLAMQKAIASVIENFLAKQPAPCFRWILGLVCGDVDSKSPDTEYDACAEDSLSSDVTEMERLFEKGSLNCFAEDCVVSRLAWESLSDSLKSRDFHTPDKSNIDGVLEFYRSKTQTTISSLRSVDLKSNARAFSSVYRSLLGLLAVARLESAVPTLTTQNIVKRVHSDQDALVRGQLANFVSKIASSQESSGFFSHPILRTCLKEVCSIYNVDTSLVF